MNIAPDDFHPDIYKETTRLRHQKIILDFFGFRPFDAKAETILAVEIAMMARTHLKPRLIFWRCLDLLIQNRVQTPGVRQLADLISKHLNTRKRELAALIRTHLPSHTSQKLDELFTSDEGISRYRLTLLKKQSQSTKPGKIKQSVVDFGVISELYQDVEPVLGMLGLGPDGVRYYAGSVLKSEIFQLQRRADADRYIHVIAFIVHQHHRLHDALADVLLRSDIHSTDTHGYTEAIFGTTYPLGFSYAPRIKNLKKQTLYHFRSRKGERPADWVIAPTKYVDEALIVQNWDEFLRLLVTIKLKVASASDIFRRLNSYSRQHSLYKTMKAFGQIIKSLFILRYIDDLELRQAIEKVLNKVELANKFTRAVAVGSPREFAQAEKEEQEIAEACNRLIKNCIICWNYLYLDRKLAQTDSLETRQHLLHSIASQSPIAWAHMLGEYDFSDEKLRDTLGILPPK